MKRRLLTPLLFLLALRSFAQTPPAGADPSAIKPPAVSPATAARINATLPKFAPPPPDESKPSEKSSDQREVDKPKNQIIRLPNYIVEEPKRPLFKERELLTPTGRLELALKRHPGLKFGNFWIFNNTGIALFMLEEEHRLERKAEMEDLASLYSYSRSPAETKAIKREVQKSFLREGGP